jgi:hypothetical protein
MGPKSAYRRGGRQKHRGYDVGGATPSIFNPPTLQDLTTTPKQNYVASLIQKGMPPLDRAGQIMAARAAAIRLWLLATAPLRRRGSVAMARQ